MKRIFYGIYAIIYTASMFTCEMFEEVEANEESIIRRFDKISRL